MTKKSNIAAALTLLPLVFLILIFSFRSEKVPDHMTGTIEVSRISTNEKYQDTEKLLINCEKEQAACKKIYRLKIDLDNSKFENNYVEDSTVPCKTYSIEGKETSNYFYLNANSCRPNSVANPINSVRSILSKFDEKQWTHRRA